MSLKVIINTNKLFKIKKLSSMYKMSSMNNKQFLRSLPFYDNNIDTSLRKPRAKKEVIIKPKISNKQILKRKNKYKKSNIFKYDLPFNNDYVNKNLLENLPFYYNEPEKSKRKPNNNKNKLED